MLTCNGRIEWDVWKLDQEALERLARDAWMFETQKADRPGYLEQWRQRVGTYLIALGERLAQRAPPVATSNLKSHRSTAA